jgi:hypothetical protein
MDISIKQRSRHRFLLWIIVLILRRIFEVYANNIFSYFTLIILGDSVKKSIMNASVFVNSEMLYDNKKYATK